MSEVPLQPVGAMGQDHTAGYEGIFGQEMPEFVVTLSVGPTS